MNEVNSLWNDYILENWNMRGWYASSCLLYEKQLMLLFNIKGFLIVVKIVSTRSRYMWQMDLARSLQQIVSYSQTQFCISNSTVVFLFLLYQRCEYCGIFLGCELNLLKLHHKLIAKFYHIQLSLERIEFLNVVCCLSVTLHVPITKRGLV